MYESLLRKFNIDRNTLNSAELETLNKWSQQLSQNQLTVPQVEQYISNMINILERELHGYDTPPTFTAFLFRKRRNRHLAARLENYLLLRDFMQAPEKAKKFVENQLTQLSKK